MPPPTRSRSRSYGADPTGHATRPAAAPTGPGTREGPGTRPIRSGPSPSGSGGRLSGSPGCSSAGSSGRSRSGRRSRSPAMPSPPVAWPPSQSPSSPSACSPSAAIAAAPTGSSPQLPASSPAPTPAPAAETPAAPVLRGATPSFDLASGVGVADSTEGEDGSIASGASAGATTLEGGIRRQHLERWPRSRPARPQ